MNETTDQFHEVTGKDIERSHRSDDSDNEQGKNFVTIYVNDVVVSIHRGHQTGVSIKTAAITVPETQVSIADVIYSIPNYDEISDEESVVIHGDERFKTSTPDGSSS